MACMDLHRTGEAWRREDIPSALTRKSQAFKALVMARGESEGTGNRVTAPVPIHMHIRTPWCLVTGLYVHLHIHAISVRGSSWGHCLNLFVYLFEVSTVSSPLFYFTYSFTNRL